MDKLSQLIYNYEHIPRQRVLDRAGAFEQIEQEFEKKELQAKIWQKNYNQYNISLLCKFKYVWNRMSMFLMYIVIVTLMLAIVIIGIAGSGFAYKYEISRRYERGLSDTIARQHILDQETCFKNEDIIKVRREKIKDKQNLVGMDNSEFTLVERAQ
jgi:hypothetical protein